MSRSDDVSSATEKTKHDMKLLTPDKHLKDDDEDDDRSEENEKEIDPLEKAFYDDWDEAAFK